VALERTNLGRALLLPLPKDLIPARRKWPDCRGLEIFSLVLNNQAHFGVRLRDNSCADVFTTLAADIAPRVNASGSAKNAIQELLGRLNRWQQFLSVGRSELSPEAQRALWGELHVLRLHILPAFGTSDSIAAWRAPTASHQDFQFAGGALEVKTTSAKQPHTIRITSERQLDSTGIPALYLHVVIVDEREVAVNTGTQKGTTLSEVVSFLRNVLSTDAAALRRFEDELLTVGYLDAHAPRYESRRYALRREITYEVTGAFPRITEVGLPAGVGDVNYGLTLAACGPFIVPIKAAVRHISSPARQNRKKR
jgi:hypothetical protein